ncbi:MAG: hypothetical protein GEU82_09745 [Luteitalea sp.]|nr:hypothetical protein [Luteitalea sp.]
MYFASPLPLWLVAVVAVGLGSLAFLSYRRPLAPLGVAERGTLMALRVLTLAIVVFFLCRPIVLLPPASVGDAIVPVLVDVSRSMRVPDADGEARIDRAAAMLRADLLPAIVQHGKPEVIAVGDAPVEADPTVLIADARRTDLAGAVSAVRDRYRGRRVAGIVLLSDGGDTGRQGSSHAEPSAGPPVFTIGLGSAEGPPDREVLGIDAGDPRLDQASVDLRVSAVSRGFGRAPFHVRVLANGQLLDSRRIVPAVDGSPIDELFTVSPDPLIATVYTAEIAAEPGEMVDENNTRSVLVSPAGRKRRVLALEGAPGHEHSFMTRALASDTGLEIDTVVRKGKNDEGSDTFIVQASGDRASALTSGFPATRENLYAYDAIVIANIEADFFTSAQLEQVSDFVSARGGGLLVMGGRSFAQRGLLGTPLEEVLPLELNDRRGGLQRASMGDGLSAPHNSVVVTPEGQHHPVMRIGSTPDQTSKLWSTLPALASSAPLGGPRPGASVLALTAAPSGAVLPLIAVQRYGRGRSMVFAGEASWRWRMMQPSTDRSYEFFWRQAARWLSWDAPEQVSIGVPDTSEPGDAIEVTLDARDRAFALVPEAQVEATLTSPGGGAEPLTTRPASGGGGRFVASLTPERPGLYHVHAEARRGQVQLGRSDRWFYVGGHDREFADPRLNEGFLRRLARESGGRYVRAADAGRVVSWLKEAAPADVEPERRDLWHGPWAFAIVIALLSAEWILRRRWGLR